MGLDYQVLIKGVFTDIPVLNCPFVRYTRGFPSFRQVTMVTLGMSVPSFEKSRVNGCETRSEEGDTTSHFLS